MKNDRKAEGTPSGEPAHLPCATCNDTTPEHLGWHTRCPDCGRVPAAARRLDAKSKHAHDARPTRRAADDSTLSLDFGDYDPRQLRLGGVR